MVMRERFLSEFDALWFDCLNGDSRETGKVTPEGKPDPSVFSTEYNREGIRIGTSVALMVRKAAREESPGVRFRQFWGVTKREDLLESLKAQDFEAEYIQVKPDDSNRFSFRPSEISDAYMSWPGIDELATFRPTLGILENRKEALVDIDRSKLEKRIKLYCDPTVEWDDLEKLGTGLTVDFARFDAKKTRTKILSQEAFNINSMRRVLVRPMDLRFCYYTSVRPLWNEPRPEYFNQCWPGNASLVSRRKAVSRPEGVPFFFTYSIGLQHSLNNDAYYFPLRLRPLRQREKQNSLFSESGIQDLNPTANLSPAARSYLAVLGFPDPDADAEIAGLIWLHALAIGYAPAYLTENTDGIRQDWPRVPLPDTAEALTNSARLGRQVAALLDTENPAPGVTAGTIRPELKPLAVISRLGRGALNPDAGDLALTVGWGHGGKDGITMPGKGKAVKRDYTPEELAAIREGASALGLTPEQTLAHLGETTYDIYLNEVAYWRNIPEKVWNYYIGGYQVVKKWLSYREQPLLGRPLTPDEVEEVTHMARRLAAIVLLEPALNANYQTVKAHSYPWPRQQR